VFNAQINLPVAIVICFHFSANEDAYFDEAAAKVPSKRQTKYNDKRAVPGGKIMEDVWTDIPRLTGNSKERIKDFQTQLPVALVRRMLDITCPKKGWVLDPFCGSGTTGVAAKQSDRRFIGFEKNEDRSKVATGRIKEA
jgi:site-specific DNA-methyltransferase (adenine-specific)